MDFPNISTSLISRSRKCSSWLLAIVVAFLACAHLSDEIRAQEKASDSEAKLSWSDNRLRIQLSEVQLWEWTRLVGDSVPKDLIHVQLESNPGVNIIGSAQVRKEDRTIHFQPRFPLDSGTRLSVQIGKSSSILMPKTSFQIPNSKPPQPAKVLKVYPTSDKLPANLLKFYIHFSTPMEQGNIYRHFSIIDLESGNQVELPFLELEQELWSRDQKRLTLFFDPGRIKRGLKPREDLGPIFEPGKQYEFRVSGKWSSQKGQPLEKNFAKRFLITPEDNKTPDSEKWTVAKPEVGSKDPLSIRFDEPLDSALIQRVLEIRYATKKFPLAKIKISENEQGVLLFPSQNWQPGSYTLRIGSELEDLCGNRIGKAFDVDLAKPSKTNDQAWFEVPFSMPN